MIDVVRDIAAVHGLQKSNSFFKRLAQEVTGRRCSSEQVIMAIGKMEDRMALSPETVNNAVDELVTMCGGYDQALIIMQRRGKQIRKPRKKPKKRPRRHKTVVNG